MCKGLLHQEGGNIQEEMVVMMMIIEGSYRDQRPPERGRYPNQGRRLPDQGGYLIEDLLEEDIPTEMEDPLEEEDTQEEDPLMEMEDPLIVEDPW